MSVVVQVFDLSGQFPLGFQRVEAQVLQKAQELALAQGREKVTLQDLDLAQVQGTEWEWVQVQDLVQEKAQVKVQELARESALPKGYRLDSEQGLVRDFESAQVTEMELG
jgi:hypothetical protein